MIGLYEAESTRRADQRAAESLGLSEEVLMENAGRASADLILEKTNGKNRFCILAGTGNNGGDGFVLARHLLLRGKSVLVLLGGKEEKLRGAAALNYQIAKACGVRIEESMSMSDEKVVAFLEGSDVVVDALLGTGATGAPKGEIARLIELSKRSAFIVSLDIPSGTSASTGEIEDPHVTAKMTVTMLVPKVAMGVWPAAGCAGKWFVVDIGVPVSKVLFETPRLCLFEEGDARRLLPKRESDIHKGNRGCLVIVGGSERYRGAPLLAARSALRSGVGLVVVAVPDFMAGEVSSQLPEAIVQPLETSLGGLSDRAYEKALLPWFDRATALVVGPGMGRASSVDFLVRSVWEKWTKPLLVDGDALFFIKKQDPFFEKRKDVVLTPHEGEAARLLQVGVDEIRKKRLASARALGESLGHAVLKGPGTLIDDGKKTFLIGRGNPALAVPGSGDVLAGCIGSFLAQGLAPMDAASLGVWLHAQAGERLRKSEGDDGILASELADTIKPLLARLKDVG